MNLAVSQLAAKSRVTQICLHQSRASPRDYSAAGATSFSVDYYDATDFVVGRFQHVFGWCRRCAAS